MIGFYINLFYVFLIGIAVYLLVAVWWYFRNRNKNIRNK